MIARAAAAALSVVAAACQLAASAPRIESDGRVAMGTVLDVQLVVAGARSARADLDAIFAIVADLEALVSHYDPASEVSRLSATSGSGPQRVDARVVELVRASLRHAELSSGAFDPTLGQLVELWGRETPESAVYEDVARAREHTGVDALRVLADDTVEVARAGVKLDFGGIAKGWALDRVRADFDRRGVGPVLLSFGQSSIWARGVPPGASEGWTLALRSPAGGFAGRVTLRDQALSVSSSFPREGAGDAPAWAPIVDPHTGWVVMRRTFAAVVAADATDADAVSTALLVLDYETGIALAESIEGVEALVVDEDGRLAMTSGWRAASRFEELGTGFRKLNPRAR